MFYNFICTNQEYDRPRHLRSTLHCLAILFHNKKDDIIIYLMGEKGKEIIKLKALISTRINSINCKSKHLNYFQEEIKYKKI